MVAFVCTHLPAMAGVSVGAAFCSETGAENVSEMVVFAATFCVARAPGVVGRQEERGRVASEPRRRPSRQSRRTRSIRSGAGSAPASIR